MSASGSKAGFSCLCQQRETNLSRLEFQILVSTEAVESLILQLRECLRSDRRALQSEEWRVGCVVE